MSNLSNEHLELIRKKATAATDYVYRLKARELESIVGELLELREAGKEPVAAMHRLVNKRNGDEHPWVCSLGAKKPSEGDIFRVEVMSLYAAPQLPAVADSIDYKALVLQIADIAHGGPVDIGLLPVTVRSMQQLVGKIPDNWVLVPKSPTREMVTAVVTGMSMSPIHCYERMIAAAPKPE